MRPPNRPTNLQTKMLRQIRRSAHRDQDLLYPRRCSCRIMERPRAKFGVTLFALASGSCPSGFPGPRKRLELGATPPPHHPTHKQQTTPPNINLHTKIKTNFPYKTHKIKNRWALSPAPQTPTALPTTRSSTYHQT